LPGRGQRGKDGGPMERGFNGSGGLPAYMDYLLMAGMHTDRY